MEFNVLRKLVNELNESNSTLEKTATLSKPEYNTDFIKGILKATENPFVQYYVTPKNLKKKSDLVSSVSTYKDIFDLLEALSTRTITGHEAISEVNAFIRDNKEYEELILNIFDRNLKTRVSEKIINKIFPNLIPTFDVALANKYDEKMVKKVNFEKDTWYASRKLDGVRCIIIIEHDGSIKAYSRNGNEFLTLDVVKEALLPLNLRDVVLDGELCIVNEDGDEDFQAILKEYNKKNHTILNPRFKIFDFITLEHFQKKYSCYTLSERQKCIEFMMDNYNGNVLSHVEQWKVKSGEHLTELNTMAEKNGWEGIMIRKDAPYEGKRSNNLLKCKKFFDAEYIVQDIDIGPFRIIVDGLEITEDMVRSVWIEHKGYPVSVGSGFSIEQRQYFYKHPDRIVGKEITVQYFEETVNQHGEISLRFPTVKAIYNEGRDV